MIHVSNNGVHATLHSGDNGGVPVEAIAPSVTEAQMPAQILPPLPDPHKDHAGYLDAMRARVTASRVAQGLPPRITSPLALDKIATIMRLPATVETAA